MANYYVYARSNAVRVRDLEGLSKSLNLFGYTLQCRGGNNYNIDPPEDSGWNSYDDEGEEEFNPQVHILPYLEDGEILITIEIGNEKLRYLSGCSTTYCMHKEPIIVSLGDVYEMVKKQWGVDPEIAEY